MSSGDTVIAKTEERHIFSDQILYKNRKGHLIVGCRDHSPGGDNNPYIIVPPAYGETKKDYVSLSYYLVMNGFSVIRYDNTFHLGASEGNMSDADLVHIQSDLLATIDYVADQFRRDQVGIVATSLAARVAFKVAASDSRVILLVSLVGVSNLQDTLRSIYREDIIEEYIQGKRWGNIDIFGHEIKDSFIGNAIRHGFHNLDTTIQDIQNVKAPIIFFYATGDIWISSKDTQTLYSASKHPKSELRVIPGAMHQLQENPRLAKRVICETVLKCANLLGGADLKMVEEVKSPAMHDIVSENKIELEMMKSKNGITREGEQQFWSGYLEKFGIIFQSPDYQELLGTVEKMMGGIVQEDRILDAGCGNGHFGMWVLEKLRRFGFIRQAELQGALQYVGCDFIEEALKEGRARHSTFLSKSKVSCDCRYVLTDLDEDLPFCDNYFNKICCNLVLSYVRNSNQVMKELHRVLKIGGKLVVSSLKPYCDLSLVYRNFAELASDERELDEARALLSNTGKIREKESEGQYHFFNEAELHDLFSQCGFTNIVVGRTLGNQANIGVGKKTI